MNIITKIEIGKKNKERVNIFIDNEYSLSISAELVYKEKLAVNQTIDVEKLKSISEEDNFIKCKNTALRIVQRSYKTEKEINDRLLLKEFKEDTINRTMEFMREYNFINDNTYAKMYIKDKSKTIGKNKIKYELAKKGVNNDIITAELSEIDSENIKEVAMQLALKKYNSIKKRECDKYKLSQKLYRFLTVKGYDYSVITEVINTVIDD